MNDRPPSLLARARAVVARDPLRIAAVITARGTRYVTPPFEGKGARARSDPRYRGQAFVEGISGTAKVTYRPPGLWTGVLFFAFTLGAIVFADRRERREALGMGAR